MSEVVQTDRSYSTARSASSPRNLSPGSLWRRWDLHVHTPETLLNDQFNGWDGYISAIEHQSQVKILGICDYLLVDNYKKILEYRVAGRLTNIDFILPNIEFRVGPMADTKAGLNIHLLISPESADHVEEIERALEDLKITYDSRVYSCTRRRLIELGRAYKPSSHTDGVALKEGVKQFKIDFTAFRSWYNNSKWLAENSIVAVAAGNDGLSGINWDSGWGATKEEIIRFSRAIFSGSPNDRKYYLGQTDPDFLDRLGGLRPCIHGCDAHNLDALFEPDLKRYCWIKADPTYEGLRQTLLEPSERVWIGERSPAQHQPSKIIAAVKIHDPNGMFQDLSIPLNPGLVAVIGQKGTGKSALVECIAYAAGGWAAFNNTTFIERAKKFIGQVSVEICWMDGSTQSVSLSDRTPAEQNVRFLSQRFVERLCAEDYGGSDLVACIQDVVFQYLSPDERLNASDFGALRANVTSSVVAERDRAVAEMRALNAHEHSLTLSIATLPEKQARLVSMHEETAKLHLELPALGTDERVFADILKEKQAQLAALEQSAAGVSGQLLAIDRLREQLAAKNAEFDKFFAAVQRDLLVAGVPTESHPNFRPKFTGNVDLPLDEAEAALKAKLSTIRGSDLSVVGSDDDRQADNINISALRVAIADLEGQQAIDQAVRTKTLEVQGQIMQMLAVADNLRTEIETIKYEHMDDLATTKASRLKTYRDLLTALDKESSKLGELYKPLSTHLKNEAEDNQSLEFFVGRNVNMQAWLQYGSSIFDQRKSLPFGTISDLERRAKAEIQPALEAGDNDAVVSGISSLLETLTSEKTVPVLKAGNSYTTVTDWLFSLDHVRLEYGLKFNGVEMDKLSPGTKGVVLLMLYLWLDKSDLRPLIVDQPEENLDSASVYGLLTKYFRRAKARRQVIIVTHNPNLVVNTDAEQIIVSYASRDGFKDGRPFFTYLSGALENSKPPKDGIRERICEIMEGGSQAFRERELRYNLTRPERT